MTTQSPTYDAFSRSVRIVEAIRSSVEERRRLNEMRLLFGAGLKEEEVRRIVGEGGHVR